MRHTVAFADGRRGVWHRPNDTGCETDLGGIKKVIASFIRAGINTVFIETVYHGMAAYRSQYVPYYTGFENNNYGEYPDYLTAFVKEAEEAGIEVHAWVEDFYIGIKENTLTREHPDWLLVTDRGETRQSEGGGFIFLDPANAQVREFLIKIYLEILSKFKVAGLNLDYIRYPLTEEGDTGFTAEAMRLFAENEGLNTEAVTHEKFIALTSTEEVGRRWTDFRAAQVTEFVREVRSAVKTRYPQLILSTAVFPEREMSYNTKKQDFPRWLKEGLLDMVTPMAYYDDPAALEIALKEMISFCGKTPCLAGLSCTYHNLPAEQVFGQIEISKKAGAQGFVFFGSKPLIEGEKYTEALHISYAN